MNSCACRAVAMEQGSRPGVSEQLAANPQSQCGEYIEAWWGVGQISKSGIWREESGYPRQSLPIWSCEPWDLTVLFAIFLFLNIDQKLEVENFWETSKRMPHVGCLCVNLPFPAAHGQVCALVTFIDWWQEHSSDQSKQWKGAIKSSSWGSAHVWVGQRIAVVDKVFHDLGWLSSALNSVNLFSEL